MYSMKLNHREKWLPSLGSWITKMALSLVAIALFWHLSAVNAMALAAPTPLMAVNSNQLQGAADEVRDRSKDLIRDTKRNVEKTARRNAAKVSDADDEGSFVERKAQRDQVRIQARAEEDAARTENAVDKSINAAKGAVENIKSAFD